MDRFQLIAKTGELFLVRKARPEDVEGCLAMISELVDEKVYILYDKKPTLEEERKWLERAMDNIRKGELIHWLVEKDRRIVGGIDASRRPMKMHHTVEIGIVLLKDARGKGVGEQLIKKMIEAILEQWKEPILITLGVFEKNERAKALYRKAGFAKVASYPLWIDHYGELIDLDMMYWKDSPLLRKKGIKLGK